MSERRREGQEPRKPQETKGTAAAKKTLGEILRESKGKGALVIYAKGEEPSVIPLGGETKVPKKKETPGKDELAEAVLDKIGDESAQKGGEQVVFYVKRVDGPQDEKSALDMGDPYVQELLAFLNDGDNSGTADGGSSDGGSGGFSDGGGGGGGE